LIDALNIAFNLDFSVCSKPPASGAKELEDYPEIHALVEKIRKIQSGKPYSCTFIYSNIRSSPQQQKALCLSDCIIFTQDVGNPVDCCVHKIVISFSYVFNFAVNIYWL
jgi:hypothetical protein